MSDLPEVKLKALPTFPARVQTESPILLDTSNGVFTFSLDIDALALSPGAFDGMAPTTTRGDLIVRGAVSNERLALGAVGQALVSNGTDAVWAGFDALAPTTTRGDLIFRNATTNARLAAGTSGYHLQAAGAAADPAWAGFLQAGSGAVERTWQSKARDFVNLLDFGAIGDGNIGNASTNATALTNALATGKTVVIPYTSDGYHFGANTIALGSGMNIVGERAVKLITTTTTMFFSCTGYSDQWGVSNVTIDGSGAGSSSTIFRFRIANNVVFRGRFDNIDFFGCVECLGDEAHVSSFSVDVRFTNMKFQNQRGRPIYLRRTRGFMYFENIQHEQIAYSTPISWEAGRFEDAVGLEINRWDVSGGATGTPTYQPGAYGLVISNATSVWLNRVEVDSTWGDGALLSDVRFLRMNQCSTFANLGNGMIFSDVIESELSDLTVTGGHGVPGDASGIGLSIIGASSDIGITNLNCNNCSAAALNISGTSSNIIVSNANFYNNFGAALNLANSCDRIVFGNGVFRNNVTNVNNASSGTHNIIHDMSGYNPVGASNPPPGASPWTYTAGVSPETLYIAATTSITQVTQGGVTVLPQATGANGNFSMGLGPNESVVITYTGTLVAKKMVH